MDSSFITWRHDDGHSSTTFCSNFGKRPLAKIGKEMMDLTAKLEEAQWLSGRVLDSRPKGRGFKPHRRHCVVVLEQDTFILA